MHSPVKSLALALGALLAFGCTEPCDGVEGERPSAWAGHEDLVPPAATLCSADAQSALMDIETEQNAFVKIVEQYEGHGWERIAQDVDSDELQSVSFVKGDSRVHVMINEENGTYSRALVTLYN